MRTIFNLLALCILGAACMAAPKKPAAAKKPPTAKKAPAKPGVVGTRGTQQMAGAEGEFGQVYTLESGFNYQLKSAHYSLAPFESYETIVPNRDDKLLIVQVAIKNSEKGDMWFNQNDHTMTAVGDDGQNYQGAGDLRYERTKRQLSQEPMKPGQGAGQGIDPNDVVTGAILIPNGVDVVKLILNKGRKGTSEQIVRYPIGGAKNVIHLLPESLRDPNNPRLALAETPGKIGTFYPSRGWNIRVDSVRYSDEVVDGIAAADGQRYIVATVTAQNALQTKGDASEFLDVTCAIVRDSDGGETNYLSDYGPRLPSRDAQANSGEYSPGQMRTFRYFISLAKEAKPTAFVFGAHSGHTYVYDLTNIK